MEGVFGVRWMAVGINYDLLVLNLGLKAELLVSIIYFVWKNLIYGIQTVRLVFVLHYGDAEADTRRIIPG